MTDRALPGLVCARICHDLAGPVGALVNGLDLIRGLEAGAAGEELAMVGQSAARAAALLKFHRLAFGSLADPAQGLARAELRARIEEGIAGPRVALGRSAPEGPVVPAPAARLVCLMLLMARRTLGLGGALRVLLPADDALPLSVIAEGPRIAVTDDQRRWLAGGRDPLPEPSQVEFALAGPAAAAMGARIELIEGGGQLALRALPA